MVKFRDTKTAGYPAVFYVGNGSDGLEGQLGVRAQYLLTLEKSATRTKFRKYLTNLEEILSATRTKFRKYLTNLEEILSATRTRFRRREHSELVFNATAA